MTETTTKDVRKTRAGVVWTFTGLFASVNGISLLTALFTPFGAERLIKIMEMFFWFDLACVIIIAAYFGVNLLEYIRATTIKMSEPTKNS